jgi:DNA-binding HxlR family transcriptional regulator
VKDNSDGSSPTPIRHVIGTLSARWGVLIVEAIDQGNTHFNELQRSVTGISHKVLIDTLRSLQRDGFVVGPLCAPELTEYLLTPLGRDLVDLIELLRDWSEDRWPEIVRANAEYDRCQHGGDRGGSLARRSRAVRPTSFSPSVSLGGS